MKLLNRARSASEMAVITNSEGNKAGVIICAFGRIYSETFVSLFDIELEQTIRSKSDVMQSVLALNNKGAKCYDLSGNLIVSSHKSNIEKKERSAESYSFNDHLKIIKVKNKKYNVIWI